MFKKLFFIVTAFLSSFAWVHACVAQGAAQVVPPPAQQSFGEVLSKTMPMFVVMFVVFHFLIIRPQKLKERDRDVLLKGLKNGDSVVTSSGIIGRVVGSTPEYVTLEIAQGVKVRVEPSHILKREETPKK